MDQLSIYVTGSLFFINIFHQSLSFSTCVANRINGCQDKYSSISASHSASGSPRSFNSTCALATRLRFTKPRFHSPTPLFETLKQNRQHITQSSRRFAPLLFSVEVNWGSIFTTPTPLGGAPGVPVVPEPAACVRLSCPPELSTCHLRQLVPAHSTGYRHRLQPPSAVPSRSHQPPATSRLLCRGPVQTVTSCRKLQQAAGKSWSGPPGKKEDKTPAVRPNMII